jgi:hypothetical protein
MCMRSIGAILKIGDSTVKKNGDEIEVSTEEASGGVTNHDVRYVLLISLLLATSLLTIMWVTGAVHN